MYSARQYPAQGHTLAAPVAHFGNAVGRVLLHTLVCCVQGSHAFGKKVALEIRKQRAQLGRSFNWAKCVACTKYALHLCVVFRIIGAQVNRAAMHEHGSSKLGKPLVYEPFMLMFAFRPRIRKIHMKR